MTNLGPRRRLALPCLALLAALIPSGPTRAEDLSATEWKLKLDPPGGTIPAPVSKDFAIPFPNNFGGAGEAVYPTTPSAFVAIGKNGTDGDIRQVWDLSTKKLVGTFKGAIGFDEKTVALSPDGLYLAGKPTFRKVVEVRATRNGRVVQSFDIDSPFLDFVDFAGKDRVVFGRLQDKKLQVADIKTGDKVCDLNLIESPEKETLAITPGRNYLAAASRQDGTLRVYDLADGRMVGEAPTPRKNGQAIYCFGLSFAPDGSELAGLFEYFGEYRVVVWGASDGKMLADFDLGKEIQRPTFFSARTLEWFPDRSSLLVLGYAIVDRSSGKKVWNLPFDGQNLKVSPRRFLDNDHALVVTFSPSMTLRTAEIPRDKIAGAVKIVKAGGNAADAALPALQAVDLSGAKSVDLRGQGPAWSVTPKGIAPSSKRLASRPLGLKGKSDDMRALLFGGGDSTQVAVVGTPQQFGQPNPTDGQARWVERFDLAGGKALGKVDLPNVSDPIGLSPDGARLLLREARTKDRVDVVSASDGKPVAGWRPFEKESGDQKVVEWAAFLGADRVLTVGGGGTLVLWSLPRCKASYIAEDAFDGPAALSPDRTLVAGFDGKGLRVLDAETGAWKGEGAAPVGLGPRVAVKALAFRPDGLELIALFQNSTLVRWDLKTGKIAGQFTLTSPVQGTSVEWAGNGHVLLDNRLVVDLATKRPVWEYNGVPAGGLGPDGRHWLVLRGAPGQESGRLAAVESPDPALARAEALFADAKAPAVLRPGSRVSLQLNLNGPPKDAAGFRQSLADALGTQLRQAGMTVVEDGSPNGKPNATRVSFVRGAAAGPDARLVVDVKEKDTGKTIQYSEMGRGPGSVQVVRLVDLACEMSLVDAQGSVSWTPPITQSMQPFGFVLRMPAGENDPEVYLKKLQWDRVKSWAASGSLPYFVARDGNAVVRLPGWTDVNFEFLK